LVPLNCKSHPRPAIDVEDGILLPSAPGFPQSPLQWKWADVDPKLSSPPISTISDEDPFMAGAGHLQHGPFTKRNLVLPDGVYSKRHKGHRCYYDQPGRGAIRAISPVRIHGDLHAPFGTPDNEQFWRELNATVAATVVFPPGSIKVLIDLYRDDDAYNRLADRTKEVYDLHLNGLPSPRCRHAAGETAHPAGRQEGP
jgi:hypothetical protein